MEKLRRTNRVLGDALQKANKEIQDLQEAWAVTKRDLGEQRQQTEAARRQVKLLQTVNEGLVKENKLKEDITEVRLNTEKRLAAMWEQMENRMAPLEKIVLREQEETERDPLLLELTVEDGDVSSGDEASLLAVAPDTEMRDGSADSGMILGN